MVNSDVCPKRGDPAAPTRPPTYDRSEGLPPPKTQQTRVESKILLAYYSDLRHLSMPDVYKRIPFLGNDNARHEHGKRPPAYQKPISCGHAGLGANWRFVEMFDHCVVRNLNLQQSIVIGH